MSLLPYRKYRVQETSVLGDEDKYGAAARVAQIDSELMDLQQGIASCLRAQELLVAQDIEIASQEVSSLQVKCRCLLSALQCCHNKKKLHSMSRSTALLSACCSVQ